MKRVLTDRWVLAFVALSLAIGLLYVGFAPDKHFFDGYKSAGLDFAKWWKTAQFDPSMRTPGYPLFLSINYELGLGDRAVMVEQALVLMATCPMVAWLAGGLGGLRAARVAAALFALCLPLIGNASLVMTEALSISLSTASVAAAIAAVADTRGRYWWVAGAAFSGVAATIVRPNALAYLAVVVVALVLVAPGWRGRAATLGLAALSVAVVFGPWVGRNYATTGHPQTLGRVQTYPLAIGVHLPWDKDVGRGAPNRRSARFFGARRPDGFTPSVAAGLNKRAELERSLSRPGEFLWARVVAQAQLWVWPFERPIAFVPYWLVWTQHLAVLALGLAGLVRLRRTFAGKILLACVAATAIAHLLSYTTPRYAVPAYPFLIVGASVVGVWLVERLLATPDRGRGIVRSEATRRS